jgi:hypothetical protein
MMEPDRSADETQMHEHIDRYVDWLRIFVKEFEIKHQDLHDRLIQFIKLLLECLGEARLSQIFPLLTVAYIYILAIIAHFIEDKTGKHLSIRDRTRPFLHLIEETTGLSDGTSLDSKAGRLLRLAEERFPHVVPIFYHLEEEIGLETYFSVLFQSNHRFLIGPAVLPFTLVEAEKKDPKKQVKRLVRPETDRDYIRLFDHVYYQLLNVDHIESLMVRYGKKNLETYFGRSKEREFILYLSIYLGWFSDDPKTDQFTDKAASLRGFFHFMYQQGPHLANFFTETFQIDIEKVEYATPKVVLGKQLFSHVIQIDHKEKLEAEEEAIFRTVKDFDVDIYRQLNRQWEENLPDSSTSEDPFVLHQTCLDGFRLVHQTIDLNDILAYLSIYLLIYERARQG